MLETDTLYTTYRDVDRLVATLGAKSTTKKVNRKAILDVDVPKACETIIHPEAPMALRLQGNLLYGVSRVYHQQCGYALMDAQTMRDRMRTMVKEIRSTGLDPSAGKARPEQLILPDDPSFIPDIMLPGLNVDLSALDISSDTGSPRKSSLLSSFLAPSSKCSHFSDGQLHLNISSSDIGGLGAGASGFPSDIGSSARKDTQFELPAAFAEETGVLLQPDFEFDGDGNIIELQFDDQMVIHDDVEMREDAGNGSFASGVLISAPNSGADPNYEPILEVSSEAPETHQRLRKKAIRTLGFDDPPELRNSDLAQWNSEYAQNMAFAAKFKQNNRLISVAKKNAAFWVMGEKVCSVDIGLGNSRFEHPLDMFSGKQMLATLTGNKIRTTRRKRSRGIGEDSDLEEAARNVRMRGDPEHEIGRENVIEHDDGYGVGLDPHDIEVGRRAPPPMYDDGSSQMPWNITASIRGSQPGSSIHSRQFLQSVGGYSSIGGPHSVTSGGGPDFSIMAGPSGAFRNRMGRMTSASPLAGRGMIGPGMRDITSTDDEEFDMAGNIGSDIDLDSSVAGRGDHAGRRNHHQDSFEIYGPAAAVDTQTAAESQWLAATLDQESANFLDFVKSKVGEWREESAMAAAATDGGGNYDDEDEDDDDILPAATVGISFSSLLPPVVNSRIVATQALLHTLTLATKGALHVRQKKGIRYADGQEGFGDIFMWLV
ncbi:hypothetical protein ACJ72_04876 [Emergomyces africanus]|uniref:Rad21/Rec8-like protein N-terminal domain-containing protein n=1 Tax=Emergomyces africanus TaxID=1955775 RepID=A0A1B7NVK8_9EURO|nr:hypothetical protein ACJ72_04876 [Emergomyces africanus]